MPNHGFAELSSKPPAQGVCNGTRAVVTHMGRHILEVRRLNGTEAGMVLESSHIDDLLTVYITGTTVFIPCMTISSAKGDFGFVLEHQQFPIRLAFAMTINK